MKTKLQLDVVRKLRDEVEEQIITTFKFIQDYNEDNQDLDGVFQKLEKLEDQFLVLKEAIQDANKLKHSDTKKTNNYYIYYLSNLNKRRAFLLDFEIIQDNAAYFTKEDMAEELRRIQTESAAIKSRLTSFNRDTFIKVEIDESLNLLK